MPRKRKGSSPGKFLANSKPQRSSHAEVDKAVKQVSHLNPPKLVFVVNLQDFGEQIEGAAVVIYRRPSLVPWRLLWKLPYHLKPAAVKDACIQAIRDEMNPTLLINQYKQDDLDQNMRRENLRITGLPEGGEGEETEEVLINKMCILLQRRLGWNAPWLHLLLLSHREKKVLEERPVSHAWDSPQEGCVTS